MLIDMARNANSDNDYWEVYKQRGTGFRGDPEDLEELVTEADNARILRKKVREDRKFVQE